MENNKSRARTLLNRMTIQEKAAQMCGLWLAFQDDGSISVKSLVDGKTENSTEDPYTLMRHGIGGISRPMGTRPVGADICVNSLNSVQKFLVEKTRLGIPALPHEENLAGLMGLGATMFPAGINMGSTWDPRLIRRIGEAIGSEVEAVGSRQGLAPVLDVSRDVRWGRTEETMGEDPYLIGILASEYVAGMQGPDRRILATLKHYVGHSLCEGGRNHAPVRIGRNELNDVFLLPFEMAVKLSGAGSVMPAYHDIDGEPVHASEELINGVLRRDWGFDGLVVSDYVAIALLQTEQSVASDKASAAALAIRAGVDMELPGYDCYLTGIVEAIDRGELNLDDVNDAVYRIIFEKYRLGLFDRPYVNEGSIKLATPEHIAVSREAAEKSIVLLKNDGLLPLAKESSIAVVGPLADDRLCMYSGYSFPVHLILHGVQEQNNSTRTLLEAITEASGTPPVYSRGCDVLTGRPTESAVFPGDLADNTAKQINSISFDRSMIADAVESARDVDTVIAVVGDLAGLFLTGTVGEGSDTTSLELPGVQQELLEALVDAGKKIVVVMISGRPYNLGSLNGRINSLVAAWLPGTNGADAIADILYGKVNPGGKLPVSVPVSAGAMPYFYNHTMKSAGTPIQEDYGAVYPFGHGLSYTDFECRDSRIETQDDTGEVPMDGAVRISCIVSNTGKRSGDETIQLYIRDRIATRTRPVKELKGFARISLEPGESRRITFTMPTDVLNFTVNGNQRIVEPGTFDVMLGTSSQDIFARGEFELVGSRRLLGGDWRMTTEVEEQNVD